MPPPPPPSQVLDVFTAIALSHVLRRLLQAGVVVVATSNKPLQDLNKVRGAHTGGLHAVVGPSARVGPQDGLRVADVSFVKFSADNMLRPQTWSASWFMSLTVEVANHRDCAT